MGFERLNKNFARYLSPSSRINCQMSERMNERNGADSPGLCASGPSASSHPDHSIDVSSFSRDMRKKKGALRVPKAFDCRI